MDVILEKKPPVTIVRLNGRMNAATVKPFEETLLRAIDGGELRVLIDFTGCDYIDSSGLRVMLIALKRLMALKGKLVLCSMNPHITKIFTIAGLTAVFPIRGTEDEGIATASE